MSDEEDYPIENCAECGEEITESTVTFQEEPYHPECFVCCKCFESLCGKLIYKVEGKRVDKECYSEFYARRCEKCQVALMDPKVKYLSYGGSTYHAECFCCTACEETLSGRKFYALEERGNVCEDCYDNTHEPCDTQG